MTGLVLTSQMVPLCRMMLEKGLAGWGHREIACLELVPGDAVADTLQASPVGEFHG